MQGILSENLEHLEQDVESCMHSSERCVDRAVDMEGTVIPALGWFSIGLGLTELLAPNWLAQTTGVGRRSASLPFMGIREIVSGVGILTSKKPSGWLWARLAGDVMDLAFLGLSARSREAHAGRLAIAAGAVIGVAMLDALAGDYESR